MVETVGESGALKATKLMVVCFRDDRGHVHVAFTKIQAQFHYGWWGTFFGKGKNDILTLLSGTVSYTAGAIVHNNLAASLGHQTIPLIANFDLDV